MVMEILALGFLAYLIIGQIKPFALKFYKDNTAGHAFLIRFFTVLTGLASAIIVYATTTTPVTWHGLWAVLGTGAAAAAAAFTGFHLSKDKNGNIVIDPVDANAANTILQSFAATIGALIPTTQTPTVTIPIITDTPTNTVITTTPSTTATTTINTEITDNQETIVASNDTTTIQEPFGEAASGRNQIPPLAVHTTEKPNTVVTLTPSGISTLSASDSTTHTT